MTDRDLSDIDREIGQACHLLGRLFAMRADAAGRVPPTLPEVAFPVGEMATHAGDDAPDSHPFTAPIPAAAPAIEQTTLADAVRTRTGCLACVEVARSGNAGGIAHTCEAIPFGEPEADEKPACEAYWHSGLDARRVDRCPGCEWLKTHAKPDDGRPGWELLPVPDVHVAVSPEAVAEVVATHPPPVPPALPRKPAAPWEPPGRVKITLAGLGIDAAAMLQRYVAAGPWEGVRGRRREGHFREWCIAATKRERDAAKAWM